MNHKFSMLFFKLKDGEKIKSKRNIIANNLYLFSYIFRHTPLYALSQILCSIGTGILTPITFVYSFQYVIACYEKQEHFSTVLYFMIVLLVSNVFMALYKGIQTYYIQPAAEEKLSGGMQLQLFEKASQLELSCYDKPRFYDDFGWAISQASDKIMDFFQQQISFLGILSSIVTAAGLMVKLDIPGLLLISISVSASLVLNLLLNKINLKKEEAIQPLKRRRDYVKRVFYLQQYAKELRLNHVATILKKDYSNATKEQVETEKPFANKLIILGFISDFLFTVLLVYILYPAMLCYRVTVLETLTISGFTGLYLAASSLNDYLYQLSSAMTTLAKQSLYIDKYRNFIDYKTESDTEGNKCLPVIPNEFQMKDVSFSYGSREEVLHNINASFQAKQKIALVGFNGAGKTTLIKLLLRLYEPSKGELLLNGTSAGQFALADYRRMFAAAFQDSRLFAASLAENVAMACVFDVQDVNRALISANFSATGENVDVHATVTKEFSDCGLEFSGGEAQKIIVSRVFYSNAPVLIMDEPSSMLDPQSEYELNKAIKEAAADKTVIYICHRLSTARLADKILFMENGRIQESGTHKQLMDLDGKYACMYRMQAKRFL